jgi:hypothetical protein
MGIMLCGNTRSGDTAVALDQGLSAKLPELLLQRFGNGFVRTWRTAAKTSAPQLAAAAQAVEGAIMKNVGFSEFFSRNVEKNKRSSTRHSSGADAWIRIGGIALRRCVIADMSVSGVRLIADASVPVPREFELMTAKGAPGRKCKIKWRNATQLGAVFV